MLAVALGIYLETHRMASLVSSLHRPCRQGGVWPNLLLPSSVNRFFCRYAAAHKGPEPGACLVEQELI